MKNIEALIEDVGDITPGRLGVIDVAATASTGHNVAAMLVRRDGEPLTALLERLDRAIGHCYDTDEPVHEIHPPAER